jgi:NDP-sugar pyrophosphorylase family protein
VREVFVNLHHLGERIVEALGDGGRLGLRITYSREDSLLDTGGALKKLEPHLRCGRFAVLNCDTIIDLDLREVLDLHVRSRATATLVLRPDPEARRYGVIETDEAGRIRRFLGVAAPEEPSGEAAPRRLSPWMFTGLQIVEPEVFSLMPAAGAFSTTRDIYPRMVRAGKPVFGFVHKGLWIAVDDAEGLARAQALIGSGQAKLSYLR